MTVTFTHSHNVLVDDLDDRHLAHELFDELRSRTSDGEGISRVAYGALESAALDVIESKARSIGLITERDAGANLVVTLLGTDRHMPFIACGSHLDSVPNGGNFDGAAGVIAGLAILAGFKKAGFEPKRSIKLFGLRGEESVRFGKAYMGSSALFGKLSADDLASLDETTGKSLIECMYEVGVDIERVKRGENLLDPRTVAAWIELHIEQGPVLVAQALPVAIVTGIQGHARHRVVECLGESGHSGTVPRWLRRDAVFSTAELIIRLDRHWRTFLERGCDIVVTCGTLGTNPREHAITRIPSTVQFSFEVRSQSCEILEAYYATLVSECRLVGEERGVEFRLDRKLTSLPAVMDRTWTERLKRAARGLGLPDAEISSGAGHDAAVFSRAGIPSAMIFVRNQHGSHNPKEAMDIDDFIKGIAIMREAIRGATQ